MSDATTGQARVAGDLAVLTEYPDRHVGGSGNRAATAYFARAMQDAGLAVSRRDMPCYEWIPGHAYIEVGGERFGLEVGPYSLPCDISAPLVAVRSVEELESEAVRGAIALLHSEIAAGQYMPRNFRFYNPESHGRVYRAIDDSCPAALIGATGRDPEMVGSQYPFPLFEDGDLDVPNAFMTDVEGQRLLAHAGSPARLVIVSERRDAVAEHVIATIPGTGKGRIVVSAHIDSRRGSPGALDNASGVATLLEVARLLEGYKGRHSVEFVPFNGEDDYANPGEIQWLEENTGRFDEIVLGINIDDSGQVGAGNHISFYDCPAEIASAVHDLLPVYPQLSEGPQWFQGDHAILGIYGRPAIAIASADMHRFMAEYAHTDRDVLALADPGLIASTADFVAQLVRRLGGESR